MNAKGCAEQLMEWSQKQNKKESGSQNLQRENRLEEGDFFYFLCAIEMFVFKIEITLIMIIIITF